MNIYHPTKTLLTREQFAALPAGGFLTLRKYDGAFCTDLVLETALGRARFITERVTERSGAFLTAEDREKLKAESGKRKAEFHAVITVAEIDNESVLNRSWRMRWDLTQSLMANVQGSRSGIVLAERLETLDFGLWTSRNAEGVCAHAWDAPWGGMFAWKQSQVYLCRVAGMDGSQSVAIACASTGRDLGRVKLGGGKRDQVRVGSTLRVEAMGVFNTGKLRQPVPCREWLVAA